MKKILFATMFVGVLVFAPLGVEASHTSSNNSWRESVSVQRKVKKLGSKIVKAFPVPVLGIQHRALSDTWGDARLGGRTHEGIDIIAPRGTAVVSPTKAVVVRIGEDTLGGIVVYTGNPGGERFYFAHLDRVVKGLKVGDVLKVGDRIGYVGNTGNASGTVPHLHFGIYKKGASNPFPRITKNFSPDIARAVLLLELEEKKKELAKKD